MGKSHVVAGFIEKGISSGECHCCHGKWEVGRVNKLTGTKKHENLW